MRVVAARIERFDLEDARRGLVLSLTDEEGLVGLGEATPLPGFSPDSADADEGALVALPGALGPIELPFAAPPAGAAKGAAAFATLRALAPMSPRLRGLPAARFALETALLDLIGQRLGLPLSASLGGHRRYAEVPVNGLLTTSTALPEMLARAGALAARGVRAIKVKLRSRGEEGFARDLQALRALRREHPDVELRLDANAAWSLGDVPRRLGDLAPLRPRFVEQPVAPELLHHLGACEVPWAADESLALEGMPERLLEAGGCAAFILKPAMLGLLRAHELGRRAQARGIDAVVTHLFDGPIALAAACELALALPRPPLACGLDAHAGLAAWPEVSIPQLLRGGRVAASGQPGLGIRSWTG
ncbi:O-succinylbenzoate synthase [Sorangium cellulosum]|uniref:O-succinylbenzoate synthase n=1 Tax=Sorangium cellulosum TaxID=56 RepID=A0A4P2PZA1_SORCE|nr:enolase C-terminal domain-like protein [Sorangium cellulosum]AUX22225.1 O-succinylbenzoate synthase [Sorangium cellulosum]